MDAILESLPLYWNGFEMTLFLAVVSGVLSLVFGTVLAALRVAPMKSLRVFASLYVEVARNTPLTLIFIFVVFVLPTLGLILPLGRIPAVIALTAYTSAFVCEAVRSGINSVGVGQAEAARAIGLGTVSTLRLIVLPQALRTVVPPLINVLIALTKNTSVAAGFTLVELTSTGRDLARDYPSDVLMLLGGVAVCYLVITIPAGLIASAVERKVVFSR
ncbi:amino acid ABC transporter permease [Sanguibacter antarcticus]|uniref:Amino acid ABC transporter membrane protein 1 (PAAT family) n=1 Tax=Sanguibacter antarcticus TaxID=372484 RepID=A0A2A9E5Q4_9MICO|nr:amino acid ABC transporter permease [Sanguibacter antarcticus]PFG33500.1 amino acid ABC transporter membrane protein 1 (PAAT family) [Sanguibacter antarcticus]